MSYTQAEIIVRYQRMLGKEVFYPMGFDDNGLPTERHVEKLHNIKDKTQISRNDFRALCVKETQVGAKVYENLWRSLGISVDWSLRYSTIDQRCQRVSQLSFIDLYRKGLIYRSKEPVLWDTEFQTALAQADLETIERKGKLYDIAFQSSHNNERLIISTTRPELIPACVALFYNPEDSRYSAFKNSNAIVPIFNQEVPILASEKVDPEFGSGLMMVCTFGDSEDVEKWKDHDLDTRICIGANGKMTDLAGDYVGLSVEEARARIVKDLKEMDFVVGQKSVKQNVSVGERSGKPVEFNMAHQWFIKVLDHQDIFLKRAQELHWYPDHMKVRLQDWINGLKYDWNISRQRYYGVPIPLWYVMNDQDEIEDIVIADEQDLPVDPSDCEPPLWAQEKFSGKKFVPETDVLDTWMTSSVSPLINANWTSLDEDLSKTSIYPMSLRVQAHEIIRTWLFYTLIKSEYHTQSLPWENIMISGWGLNEQGKKISKRSLDQETSANGYNRYNPEYLISRYGADAIRYWAAGAKLGQDLRFSEKEIKRGKAVVVKLWNAVRMAFNYLSDFDLSKDHVPFSERTLEDKWIMNELNMVVKDVSQSMDIFDYSTARATLDRFFYMTYCDNYLEMIKLRFQDDVSWGEEAIKSTQSTLFDCTKTLLGLFAPFIPFVTEELYQKGMRFGDDKASIHQTSWPKNNPDIQFDRQDEMDMILLVLSQVRKIRSDQKIGSGALLEQIVLSTQDEAVFDLATNLDISLRTATRTKSVLLEKSEAIDSDSDGGRPKLQVRL